MLEYWVIYPDMTEYMIISMPLLKSWLSQFIQHFSFEQIDLNPDLNLKLDLDLVGMICSVLGSVLLFLLLCIGNGTLYPTCI